MQLSPLNAVIPSFGAPTLEGFDMNNIQDGKRLGGNSARQMVRFYKKKFLEVCGTGAKGVKPYTKEVEREMVKIITPGDKAVIDDFAQDYHRREYFQHYKAFRDGRTVPLGKGIEECEYIPSNISTELKYLGVHTEEQFAAASDYLCDQLANGWILREYARQMVKVATENQSLGQVNVLRGELEKSQELIREMQSQLNSLLVKADGTPVEQSDRPKRGRPALKNPHSTEEN